MKLTILGCGDAFGSGGRLQTSYHIATGEMAFLIDCGATALIGMQRAGLDPNHVDTILISHLHGDHYAGLIWWLLHSQHVSRRQAPLTVIGPPTIEARFTAAAEALFPRSTQVPRRFPLTFVECRAGETLTHDRLKLTAFEVSHPSGAPSHALRLELDGKVLSFTGDSEWVDCLVDAGRNADLYIMECYQYETPVRYHMSWKEISSRLDDIAAKRVLLTHMAQPMLANRHLVDDRRVVLAEDGLVVDI